MGSQLSDVVGIIDMDGFMVSGRFYCKELGMLKAGEAAARSWLFDAGLRWTVESERWKDVQIR